MGLASVGYLPLVGACHSWSVLTASVYLATECESLAMFDQTERLRIGTPQGPTLSLGEGVLKGSTGCRKFPREWERLCRGTPDPFRSCLAADSLGREWSIGVGWGRRQIPPRGSDKPAPARRPPGRAPELGVGRGGEDPDRDTPPARAGRNPERQAGSGQRGAESRGAAECAFVRAVLELVLAGPADRAPASAPGPVHTWRG